MMSTIAAHLDAAFSFYVQKVETHLKAGNATEHTYRSALETLIQALASNIIATNEPKRIKCGAPDFIVTRQDNAAPLTLGYIEAKDVGVRLDDVEKSEQLTRYLNSLNNLLLTDYLEFRWYVNGEWRETACIGTVGKNGAVKVDQRGKTAVQQMLLSFIALQPASITTPRDLAVQMARLTTLMRNLIVNMLSQQGEQGELYHQLLAFRSTLLPALSVAGFADMYAQTIAYGLFAARIMQKAGSLFTREHAAYLLPKTNPFLRKLFIYIAGPDLDERVAWLADDIAQLLAYTDMAAILRDFGKHTRQEDPVVHFYETFLATYDPSLRERRGVYYTPEPVVSFMVRAVDELLVTHFRCLDGLADQHTLILDPATGTATFLYTIVNTIYERIVQQGGFWHAYVEEILLKRLFGFELLMAPYTMAHLKLGLLLQETGYHFHSEERLGVYLTNTLEQAIKSTETLQLGKWISDEANAAADIKRDKPIMVVIGNPPYSGHSANKGTWMVDLLNRSYKIVDGQRLDEKNPKWLQDDYVKFVRFGQWRIDQTGQGILALITNHGYLDNPTFRGMRQSLMQSFSKIYLLDLHGNSKKRELAPDDGKDENVFDIQQGVAIALFVKQPGKSGPAKVYHAHLWGTRVAKYQALATQSIQSLPWQELTPHSPSYWFMPRNEDHLAEYEQGWKITNIFSVHSVGVVTARDHLTIRWNAEDVWNTVTDFAAFPPEDARAKYGLGSDTKDWQVTLAQKDVKMSGPSKDHIVPILYRPFDVRYTYYTGNSNGFHCRPRLEVARHMLAGQNMGLSTTRSIEIGRGWEHMFCTSHIIQHHMVSLKEVNYLFPLYLYPASSAEKALFTTTEQGDVPAERRPNLSPAFIEAISVQLGLHFIPDGQGDLETTFGPEDIFYYAYAVFHSPTYRARYAELLKTDFPRLPLTSNISLFASLIRAGKELAALHMLRKPVQGFGQWVTTFPVAGSMGIEQVRYDPENQRAYINKTQYFGKVAPEVWDFHVGGYQVLEKWLKDRMRCTLTMNDLHAYNQVVAAIQETMRLMQEIDQWLTFPLL